MNNLLLKIENLEASINNKKILKKFNLEIKENEIRSHKRARVRVNMIGLNK